MYIPIDPYKIDGYWEEFRRSLEAQKLAYVIINKRYVNDEPHIASSSEIDELINRLKNVNYVRIGSQHMRPEPCHFSMKPISYDEGIISELITCDDSIEQITRDINFIIQFVFFDCPKINKIIIPFKLDIGNDIDFKVEIDRINNETKIIRK